MQAVLLAVCVAVCVAACPTLGAAQTLDGARATVQAGALSADPATPFRLHGDAALGLGPYGLQLGASFANDDLTDLSLIGYRNLGPRWRIGAEVETSTDPAFDGADLIWGLRLRYSDAGGTVDTRGGLVSGGPDGAFFVTVAMAQDLGPGTSVRGLLHRYSVNDETGDFFAIGLGVDLALSDRWTAYGDGIWALRDDLSAETTGATLGLRRQYDGHTVFAGVTGHSLNGSISAGLTAGLTVQLDRPGTAALFDTDPWAMQLTQIGY